MTTFKYNGNQYASELQTDYKEYSSKYYTIEEIKEMHEIEDNNFYIVNSELQVIKEISGETNFYTSNTLTITIDDNDNYTVNGEHVENSNHIVTNTIEPLLLNELILYGEDTFLKNFEEEHYALCKLEDIKQIDTINLCYVEKDVFDFEGNHVYEYDYQVKYNLVTNELVTTCYIGEIEYEKVTREAYHIEDYKQVVCENRNNTEDIIDIFNEEHNDIEFEEIELLNGKGVK